MSDMPKEFRDGPHTVKFMRADAKKVIFFAAKRAKLTQGEWLEQAAREKLAREREDRTASQVEVLPPDAKPESRPALEAEIGSDLSLVQIDLAARLVEHLAALRGQKLSGRARNVSARTLRDLQRLLLRRLSVDA